MNTDSGYDNLSNQIIDSHQKGEYPLSEGKARLIIAFCLIIVPFVITVICKWNDFIGLFK